MSQAQKSNLKAAAIALFAFFLFATHDVLVKQLGASYAAFQIIFFSVLLSFPLVMLMLMRDASPGTLLPVHPWWTAIRTVCVVVTASCAFYAFSVLPLAQVYAILFATPLFITVLAIPMLSERVGMHRWGAIVLGLIGVLIALRPGSAELGLGHLAAIIAALGSAFASVIVRKIGKDERSAVLMVYPMMANVLLMGGAMVYFYEPMPVQDLGLVGILAVLAFGAGLCMIWAYKSGDAAIVAPMQYSQMLWASLYGALFFNEFPDTMTWIGAGLIALSGIYVVARESFGGKSENTPVLSTKSRSETGTSPRVSVIERIIGSRQPAH